ncbi:hypothetical protein ACLOJK_022875 [Asimina triloba]
MALSLKRNACGVSFLSKPIEALFRMSTGTTPVREFPGASMWVATPPLGSGHGGRTDTHHESPAGYALFSGGDSVETINNPPDPTPGWKSRFFFAQLSLERDVWGIPERWVKPLPDPLSESEAGLTSSQRLALMYLRGTVLCWFPSQEEFLRWCESLMLLVAVAPVPSLLKVERRKERSRKRARPSVEGSSPVDLDPSVEGFSKLSPIRGTSPVSDHGDGRRAFLPHEEVAQSKSRETELLLE